MINNYDSVVSCNSSGTPHSQKQEGTSYTATKRNWLSFVMVFVALFSIAFVQGQSTANYAFSTNTSGSLALDANGNAINMSTGTTQMVAGGADDSASSVFPMGFNYYGMGTFFNSFSANSNESRVRVEFSKKTLAIVTSRREGTFLIGRLITSLNSLAVSKIKFMSLAVRSFIPSRCFVLIDCIVFFLSFYKSK